MKKSLLILLGAISMAAQAECYMRSSIRLTQSMIEHTPTDVQRLVVPDRTGYKCITRYRVVIQQDWQTVEGTATGSTEGEACARAMDISRGSLLEEAVPDRVSSDSQMVCSDLPDIRVRRVRIGETIYESEVDVHTIPQERPYFNYKRVQCRMFVERDTSNRNLFTYQGIICRKDSSPNSKWLVVDKY